jgi:hypothetical protein
LLIVIRSNSTHFCVILMNVMAQKFTFRDDPKHYFPFLEEVDFSSDFERFSEKLSFDRVSKKFSILQSVEIYQEHPAANVIKILQ